MLKASYKYLYKSEKELNCFPCMCVCIMWTEKRKKKIAVLFLRNLCVLHVELLIDENQVFKEHS